MIFRKNIAPRCAYCAYGSALNEQNTLCSKKGVVLSSYHCKSFKYDAIKRIPPRRTVIKETFGDDDFSIE